MPRRLFQSGSSSTNSSSTLSPSSNTSLSSSSPSIPTTFNDNLPLPSIIVFDLDYTLWPFWVDTHVSGPLKPVSNSNNNNIITSMIDRWGESFTFYPGVSAILYSAKEKGITMSLASRTHAPDLAKEMLRNLHIIPPGMVNPTGGSGKKDQQTNQNSSKAIDYFTQIQIYPGSKSTHFTRLQETLKKKEGKDIKFHDMLFFDDEIRNKNVETELGVTFHLVKDGITKDEVDKGIWAWRKRKEKLLQNQQQQQNQNQNQRNGNSHTHIAELEG